MDNSGLFKYKILLDIILRLIMPSLKAVALKLRPWLIKMYDKMEVKNHSNRRTSNQLKYVRDFWQIHGF